MPRTKAEIESQIGLSLANQMIQILTQSLAAKEIECDALKEKVSKLTPVTETPTG
jgi:hypothetical protein